MATGTPYKVYLTKYISETEYTQHKITSIHVVAQEKQCGKLQTKDLFADFAVAQ